MATIKSTSNALGNLINQINSAGGATTSNPYSPPVISGGIAMDDESIPENMLMPERVFDINYKSTKKQCIKKAKEQLTIIVKEVVPQIMQNSTMITDKISQDAEQLGNLYYEYEKSDKVVQALMETIARGETQARLFDTYSKLSDSLQKLSSKITETQNQMRKYYIDTYLDLQQKDEADDYIITEKQKPLSIEAKVEEPDITQSSNVIVGTENTIRMLEERKKKAMIAKFQEVK